MRRRPVLKGRHQLRVEEVIHVVNPEADDLREQGVSGKHGRQGADLLGANEKLKQ